MKRSLLIIFHLCLLSMLPTGANAQIAGGLPANWQNIRPLDTGVVASAAFSIGTRAYIIGGDTSEYYGIIKKFSNSVYRYDSTTNTWTTMKRFPGRPRIGAVAFSLNGKGYYGLGQDTTAFLIDSTAFGGQRYILRNFLRDWYEYDPLLDSFFRKADFPSTEIARAFASSFVYRTGDVGGFVFGEGDFRDENGTYKGKYFDELWEYNPTTNTWTKRANYPNGGRSAAVAFSFDNDKLAAGLGQDGRNGVLRADMAEYNRSNNTWVLKDSFPIRNGGKVDAGSFSFANVGFVVCGFDGQWSKEFWQYDGTSGVWQQYPDYIDSGRHLGVSWMIGRMGYYGTGFRGNNDELRSIAKYLIDTNTILITTNFPDSVCAGDSMNIRWSTGRMLNAGNTFQIQMSDSAGLFVWPPTPASIIATQNVSGVINGSFNVRVPKNVLEGRKYRYRIIASNPYLVGRASDTFYVKQNAQFVYNSLLHPLIDTICLNTNFFIPINASGTAYNTNGRLTYQWRKNGVNLSNGGSVRGATSDTLFLSNVQVSDGGIYDVIVKGDCYPDTSLSYRIAVVNIPRPTITTQLRDANNPGNNDFCENQPFVLELAATGSKLNYQWYFNNDTLKESNFILGLGTPRVSYITGRMSDSGWYKVNVFENCGAFTFTDSFLVGIRRAPEILEEPQNIFPGVLEGNDVGFKVTARGHNLSYRWRKGFTLLSDGAKFSGTSTDTLTIKDIKLNDVDFYSVIVSGTCAPPDTSNLAILEVDVAPFITRHPRDTTKVCEGSLTSINVLANGANLGYQWFKNGSTPVTNGGSISGANTRIIEFTNVTLSDAGSYRCDVDNGQNFFVSSNVGHLVVIATPPKPVINKFGPILQSSETGDSYIWFFNGTYMPQYTTRSITIPPSDEGDYTVRIIRNNCVSPLSDPTAYFLSVNKLDNVRQLEVYPNPTSEILNIGISDLEAGTSGNLQIMDLSGKVIWSNASMPLEKTNQIKVDGLSKGMYLITITSSEAVYTARFMKQ